MKSIRSSPILRFGLVLVVLVLVHSTACIHSERNPAPMPPLPDGACDAPVAESEVDTATPEAQDIVPTKRVAPLYPRRAIAHGVQGWVCLGYTITRRGTVEDLEVIASAPEGYLEDAAAEAIRQWRYTPKMENGQPVAQPGIRVMLRFEIRH